MDKPTSAEVPSAENLGIEDFETPSLVSPHGLLDTRSQSKQKRKKADEDTTSNSFGNTLGHAFWRSDPKESRYRSNDSQAEGDIDMPFSDDEAPEAMDPTHQSRQQQYQQNQQHSQHNQGNNAYSEYQEGQLEEGDGQPTNGHLSNGEPQTLRDSARSQTFSALRKASLFNRSGQSESQSRVQTDGTTDESRKTRKLFTMFRKKNKDKDRPLDPADFEDEELAFDEDHEAGERAQGLIRSLALGSPAINLLASCLCEDEYGLSRAPLLVDLMGIKVTDISRSPLTKNRAFRIDLEYGVSAQRLKWSVEKTAKDLLYLHSRLKWLALRGSLKSVTLPKYPVPPSLRRSDKIPKIGKLLGDGAHPFNVIRDVSPAGDGVQSDNHSMLSGQSFRDRMSQLRAHFSAASSVDSSVSSNSPEQTRARMQSNQKYVREIERYLNELNSLVGMRPQSNRLFYFFEISPISSLLSYETGYIGKQGVIHVGGTAKSQGWRVGHFKANDLKGMIDRRSEKWFLIRGSYVMYVSDIISTTPIEVFLVDPSFKMTYKGESGESHEQKTSDIESDFEVDLEQRLDTEDQTLSRVQNKVFMHLKIVLENNERKLVIVPKSRVEQQLWIRSFNQMVKSNVWAETHRFGSFAPIRTHCYAQWLVDARDYFWAVSSALEMAKDIIFIHDWWLSPELYLRRPANGNQQFRIDRILQRKAHQGVKIFVIVYRNVGTTIPIDSLWTKHSILSLNQENIHVIRSPNQLLQNTYFWAHHEKLCVIDYNIAFIGGIDLCYGRYDTCDHVLADDSSVDFGNLESTNRTQDEIKNFRIFPGKDYSNTRVKDFSNLNKPYESMYDRNIIPRMPWHDIHMMTSGEVARDLSRHFVQRWNYLLRQKRPSRLTPLLTPPSDMTPEMVKDLNLDGTCEVQVLRSAGSWSLGLKEHDESIHQAYLKLIETSEHFIYIENQFFVTSCFIDGTEIKNRIGDALVDRIIRAHKEGKAWKAIILIPLVPGFESQVDQPDGSSVRVVMQCEYMSISRGASSLFAKLRKADIDPDEYIQFFSLRKWGILGPNRHLVTEQLYIHAKCMIVDDRVAIIGSANINERSMRGTRDSEVAVVVRDTDTVKSTMDGKPYRVGKFAHSLRLRLMREHLGIAVDYLDIVERKFEAILKYAKTEEGLAAVTNNFKDAGNRELSAAVELASRHVLQEPEGTPRWKKFCKTNNISPEVYEVPIGIRFEDAPKPAALPISFNNRTGPHEANIGIRDRKKHSFDPRVQQSQEHKDDVYGTGADKFRTEIGRRARLDNAKFLRNLARELMEEVPDKSFLPDVENVRAFLDSDDDEVEIDVEGEGEGLLSSRNKERWNLLKKISYLQLVAARDAKQAEYEVKKRVAAGFPASIYNSSTTGDHSSPDGSVDNEPQVTDAVNVTSNKASGSKPTDDIEVLPGKEQAENSTPEIGSEQIPIVTLDDAGFRDTIQKINQPGSENVTRFIDPYNFDDPLDPDFYEDIWFENARRNTDIYRLIFHCQPDDLVPSWKEYMQHMKLSKAFKVSQDNEPNYRRGQDSFDSPQTDPIEEEKRNHARRSSRTTINMADYQEENGILGEIPNNRKSKKRQGRGYNNLDKTIEEDSSSTQGDNFANGDAEANGLKARNKSSPENDDDSALSSSSSEDESGAEDEADGDYNEVFPELNKQKEKKSTSPPSADTIQARRARKRRAGTFSARRKMHAGEKIYERDSAQRILQEIKGHLVLFPVDWLSRELEGGNWFFNTDRIPPIEIYD